MKFWQKAKHWSARAEEVRRIAELMPDASAKTMLQCIAAEYEELAELAKQAEQEKLPRYVYRGN